MMRSVWFLVVCALFVTTVKCSFNLEGKRFVSVILPGTSTLSCRRKRDCRPFCGEVFLRVYFDNKPVRCYSFCGTTELVQLGFQRKICMSSAEKFSVFRLVIESVSAAKLTLTSVLFPRFPNNCGCLGFVWESSQPPNEQETAEFSE